MQEMVLWFCQACMYEKHHFCWHNLVCKVFILYFSSYRFINKNETNSYGENKTTKAE